MCLKIIRSVIFIRFVYIWDTTSRRILYKLPGHLGSVNDVDFHKLEPISKEYDSRKQMHAHFTFPLSVLSASSDKQIYLGEFDG